MDTCPHCNERSLQFSRSATITHILSDDKSLKVDKDNIEFLDECFLYCTNCNLNESDSDLLCELMDKYIDLLF